MLGNTKILKYWVGKTQKMPLKIFKKFGLALTIVAQNQVKTLSWENSGKSNLTPPPPPPPPKGKVLATALASVHIFLACSRDFTINYIFIYLTTGPGGRPFAT
jgi:hypothetical protein